jgi:hypothetical protein
MATYTKNYNLVKPAPEDFGDVADLNANADKVDEVLKKKADLDAGGKLPAEQLPTLSYIPTSEKGKAGGVASLGQDGKVPAGQLPSLDYIPNNQKGQPNGVATLGSDGKVPSGQLPSLDYIPTAQKGAANGVATLDGNRKVPVAQIPVLDYIPTSQKGTAGGVATLGADGKIPESQLGAVGVPPQIIVTVPSGSAVTCKSGSKTLSATSTGTVTFALPAYGTWTVTATLNGQTATENVVVDDVKQYRLSLAYFSATLRVTSESGATVTATGPKTVSGTVPSNGVLDLKITAPGTYAVSASKSGEKTETVSVQITNSGQTYTAECLFFNKVLANNTWAQISKASATGKASQLWSVGDTKDITVGSETLTLVIMGFNHDDLASGGKAGITFGMKNLMATTRRMNASNTNSGGFTGSEMYSWLQNTLLPTLPSDLQAVLKSVNKKTSAGSQSSTINTNSMKLFLFSEIEIFGSTTYSKAGEGSQYSYFATAANRIKYLSNGSGSAFWWWERSPHASNSANFCFVDGNGGADYDFALNSVGVCFGFCV